MLEDIHKISVSYVPEYVPVRKRWVINSKTPVRFTFRTPNYSNDETEALIDAWTFTKNFGDDLKLSWTPNMITISGTPIRGWVRVDPQMMVYYHLDDGTRVGLLSRIKRSKSKKLNL